MLPAAIDRYVTMVIKLRDEYRIILRVFDLDASAKFSLKELDKKRDLRGEPLPD